MKDNLERVAKWLIFIGLAVIMITAIIFFWNEWNSISLQQPINNSKFGDFGSFISGFVGTLWALAGVFLFYIALKDQREDIQLNRDALMLQVQALEQQIKEFRLQTQELEETRKVFIDQTKTQKLQRFESTFFQLIHLHHEIVNNLTKTYKKDSGIIETSGRTIFENTKLSLDSFTKRVIIESHTSDFGHMIIDKTDKVEDVKDVENYLIQHYYAKFYKEYEDTLNHYFRNLYHIFKYIHTSILVDGDERKFYSTIIRAQLSQNELYLILFNSLLEEYGYPKFTFLVKNYEILQNFNPDNIPNKIFLEYYKQRIAGLTDPFK